MFEVQIGKTFRRAEAERDKRLLVTATSVTSALDFFVGCGEAITARRQTGLSLDEAVNDGDLIAYLPVKYMRIRRFVAPFLTAFTLEGNSQSRDFIKVAMQMTAAGKSRSRSSDAGWMHAALDLIDERWSKEIKAPDGSIDRRILELFIIIELKNRIGANEIWTKGSRTYRALYEDMISPHTYAIIRAEARIPVAIPVDVDIYLVQKAEALGEKLHEAASRLEAGRGDTRIGAKGLPVTAVRTVETEAALVFARRVASNMPPIRLTDLVADVDLTTGFSSLFEHLQIGRTPGDIRICYAALIAEANYLGFSQMALACPFITRRQLQQLAIWHFKEETFTLALAKLAEAQHAAPFATVFGSHTISSSDGQHIHLGESGEIAGGVNGRYGTNPILKLYTAISCRSAPFHSKISAAMASEAVHVLEALLETDAGLDIV